MKVTVNINEKIGQPNYGSYGAVCTLELDVDQALINNPDALLGQLRLATRICEAHVSQELDRRRTVTAPAPAREAGSDDEAQGEDLRPGDRGYREPARDARRSDDGRSEERRRDDRDERSAAYQRDYPDEDRPADRRPSERGGDRRSGDNGLEGTMPRNGRQLAKWLQSQPRETEAHVKRIMKAQDYGWKYIDLYDDDVDFIVRELGRPEPRSHRNGQAERSGSRN